METLLLILAVTLLDALAAFVGMFTLMFSGETFRKVIFILVAFSAGTLFSGALLHLFAEAIEPLGVDSSALALMGGFSCFFLIERVLHWHHCHSGENCKVHAYSYLILLGDGIHNFIDGLVIAAAFVTDINLGFVAAFLILAHEIPQELGDFAVLLHGGMKRRKAIVYNFASQTMAVVGGVVGYIIQNTDFTTLILPFAAGGFIYISASDLIPELHKEADLRRSMAAFAFFIIGVTFMTSTKFLLGE